MRCGLILTMGDYSRYVTAKQNTAPKKKQPLCNNVYQPVKEFLRWKWRSHLVLTKPLITKGLHFLLISKVVWRENTEIYGLLWIMKLVMVQSNSKNWIITIIKPKVNVQQIVFCKLSISADEDCEIQLKAPVNVCSFTLWDYYHPTVTLQLQSFFFPCQHG